MPNQSAPADVIPVIRQGEVPEDEREAAGTLHSALLSMQRYVAAFANDLDLFNWCSVKSNPNSGATDDDRARLLSWRLVAARDGSMNIFHFGKSIIGAEQSLALP